MLGATTIASRSVEVPQSIEYHAVWSCPIGSPGEVVENGLCPPATGARQFVNCAAVVKPTEDARGEDVTRSVEHQVIPCRPRAISALPESVDGCFVSCRT